MPASLPSGVARTVHKRLTESRKNRRPVASVFAVAVCALVLPAPAFADAPVPSDLIVNIARYTSWPGDVASKGLTVCIAHGGASTSQTASTSTSTPTPIAGETLYEVRRLPVTWRYVTAPTQLHGCNIVWLNADVRPAPREWLSTLNEKPVLTLSNYPDFTVDGGIIGAYRSAGEWRFEVSLEALQRSRLGISAVALRLSQKPPSTASVGAPR